MNVYEKLLKVQTELKAPKGQYNSFGKYAYRSCEDILEALKPVCQNNKALTMISDEIVNVEGRQYVRATATFIDVETGEKVQAAAMAREEETKKGMDASQITGSTSSYARKYALNGLFCIDDTKDADATNTHGKDKPEVISEKQVNRLLALAKGKDVEQIKKIISFHGFNNSKEITKDKYNTICIEIESI